MQEFKAKTNKFVYKSGLPVLTVGGKQFAQSNAMLRFAGRKANLYSDDLLEALRIDEVLDTLSDILSKCPPAEKQAREEYAAGKMNIWMQRLEECCEESSTGWIAGTKDISIADLAAFQLLHMIRTNDFSHVPSDYTDKWQKLSDLEKRVVEHPIYKSWQEKKASKQ